MPLSDADVVQENFGTTTSGTSHVVSLPSATTADNTLLVYTYSTSNPTGLPSGFSLDFGGGDQNTAVYRKIAVASETSWTFTTAVSASIAWRIEEWSGIDSVSPLDVSSNGSDIGITNGETLSTGTTAQSAALDVVAIAIFGELQAGTSSWSSYTNSFEEVAETTTSGSGISQLSVARKFQSGTTSTFQCTGTIANTGTDSNASARMLVYRAANSPIVAPLAMFVGFEWGTHGGITANTGNAAMLGNTSVTGTFGTTYAINASYARNSSYGLRIAQSAATGAVRIGGSQGSGSGGTCGMNVRVVSATGTVMVASILSSIGSNLAQLLYDSSTNKFGVRCSSTGTSIWESGTTALNTWRWVEWRVKSNTSTYHVDWQIETGSDTYTAQTSPTDLTGQSIWPATAVALGDGSNAQTMTAEYDDVVFSTYYSAWPLGPHQIRLLIPETTGASVSGTSSNFSKFTSNGTLAAWGSDAGALLDEVPPTVSASSDGVVQTAVAASDYMQFPMTTYTCDYNEVIAGVRMLCSEWGGTGSGTGTLGFRGYDGTTETTFIAASSSYDADSLTAISVTYPRWACGMWPSTNGWTQAELDAAALRIGFSTDATPDMGISAAYIEVAVKKIPAIRTLTAGEADEFKVDLVVHPYTSATVSYVITNDDATRDVTFDYSISGTPQTPVVVGPSANSTLQLNAAVFGDISDITLTPEVL